MTDKEYEQQRRECWIECAFGDCNLGDASTPVTVIDTCKQVFDWAFDRAYALGKVKETITQEEIEKAADEFADEIRIPASFPGVMVPFINGLAHDAYLQGAQDFIGKQEKDAGTVIQGWVARDFDGDVFLYQNEPDRDEIAWNGYMMHSLPVDSFPDLTWDDDPIEVELTIKRKNNG